MRVGVCGFATSGKDVVASVLVERFGFVKVNMSDALARDLWLLNPLIESPDGAPLRLAEILSVMSFDTAKAAYPDLRRLLQRYGTEVWRAVDVDTWVRRAAQEAAKHDRVVTTGIRFLNELAGIDTMVRVVRPGVGPVNDHVSDAGIEEVARRAEHVLLNDGSRELLEERTVAWAEQRLGLR